MTRTRAIDRAMAAWETPLPDWVRALAEAADASSQREVGRRIDYSPAVVNQVLGRTYGGDLGRVETAVRGALLAETVDCPVLGPLAKDRCLEEQAKPFSPTSQMRVQLYRACKTCPNRRSGGRS